MTSPIYVGGVRLWCMHMRALSHVQCRHAVTRHLRWRLYHLGHGWGGWARVTDREHREVRRAAACVGRISPRFWPAQVRIYLSHLASAISM